MTTTLARHQLARRAGICLVLGLITTWFVAWQFALIGPLRHTASGTATLSVPRGSADYIVVRESFSFMGGEKVQYSWGGAGPSGLRRPHSAVVEFSSLRPTWGLSEQTVHRLAWVEDRGFLEQTCWGWPLPALWDFFDSQPKPAAISGGIQLPVELGWTVIGAHAPRSLPYLPRWTGLIVDTLFFAILWLPFLIPPRSVRAWWRMRKGRCPRCGYDLLGDLAGGCSECGWRRPPPAVPV